MMSEGIELPPVCELCNLPIWKVDELGWSHYGDISDEGTDHEAKPGAAEGGR